MATFKSKLPISSAQINPALNTHLLFDMAYVEPKKSAIDEFMTRLIEINKLSPKPSDFSSLQGQLVLLGVIAAVESYLRTILRRLIDVDDICQENVQRREVSYSAAIHLDKRMMPEAFLERISFISKQSIVDSIRDLVGIKGNIPTDLDTAIKDYVQVCQLRHCAVHRFGKLGTSNAIELGLPSHKKLLEKPLMLDYASLQNSILISTTLVKTVNGFLFNEAVSRLPPTVWHGTYTRDKKLFGTYYQLFADTVSFNGATVAASALYKQFQNQRALHAAGQQY